MRQSLIILLYFLYTLPCRGQAYFPVEHLTEKDGLSYRDVQSVYKDSKGFIWVATTSGLDRYDGVEFTHYKVSDSSNVAKQDNLYRWVMEDDNSNFLVGVNERIGYLDLRTGRFLMASLQVKNKPLAFEALHPFTTPDGEIMAPAMLPETGEICLIRYAGDGQFEFISRLKSTEDWSLYKKLNESVEFYGSSPPAYWYELTGMYYCLNTDDLTWKRYEPNPQNTDSVSRFWYPALHPSKGQLFDSFELPFIMVTREWKDFTFDNNHNIWFRDGQNRMYKYDVRSREIKVNGAFEFDRFRLEQQLLEDEEGILWFPHRFGISTVKKRQDLFQNYLNAPTQKTGTLASGCETYSIIESHKGMVYAFGCSLYQIDPETGLCSVATPHLQMSVRGNFFSGEHNLVIPTETTAITSKEGYIWINYKGELWKYDPDNGSLKSTAYPYFQSPIDYGYPTRTAIQDGGRDTIWLLYWGDLLFYNKKTGEYKKDSHRRYPALTGILKKDGDFMWASSETGLARFSMRDTSVEQFHFLEERCTPRTNMIYTIVPYRGVIWMGTRKGLLQFDPESKVLRTWTKADGLPHDIIYTILAEKDNLWLGTHSGLCKFNINTGAVRNYFVEDGLTHNEFNREAALKASDGRMYFGGMNGINAFYPDVLDSLSKLESSHLVWTGFSKVDHNTNDLFSVMDHQLDTLRGIQLHYDDKSFTFRYALLSFSDPLENKYYYYLDGLENDWNYNKNVPYVNFPSLPPGHYTLRIKAIDSHGNPGLNELSIPVAVKGPWWNTWWAYTMFALLVVSLFWGIRSYELKRLSDRAEAQRLKEMDSMKARLYTNITHEFRTPLTVIMGLTENINGHEQERNLIRRNSRKLLTLVNQMLDLSKIDHGAIKLKLHQSDVISFLNYLTESFYSMAKEKDIRLNFYSEEPALVMDFDDEKLQHVVYNLLSNAMKFTKKGGKVILHVRKIHVDDLPRLQIKMQDTGTGIPKDKLPYIFDRFYQADDTHTRAGEGTGIGLALTKEYISLMGGDISVASSFGEGSEFIVLLPVTNKAPFEVKEGLEAAEGRMDLNQPETIQAGSQDLFPIADQMDKAEKPVLLIIEDNQDVAFYIESLLQKDYQVEKAADGKSGRDKAFELIPDIIISDVMMPEMDGYTLTRILKQDERTSHIPIIILTAKAEEQDRLTGLEYGADAFLIKPFNKKELMIRLEKLTELRKRLQQRYASLEIPLSSPKAPTPDESFLQKLIQIVEEHLDETEFSVSDLCRAACLSQPQLFRKLKALTGKSPSRFIRSVRLRKAVELLTSSNRNISEIAWETGFSDPNYFSRVFHQEFGKSPSEWAR